MTQRPAQLLAEDADRISTPLTTEISDASVASSAEASVELSSSGAATVPAKRKAGDMTAVDRGFVEEHFDYQIDDDDSDDENPQKRRKRKDKNKNQQF